MIISVSPPSSLSHRYIMRRTKELLGDTYFIKTNHRVLLVKEKTGDSFVALIAPKEILLSFSGDDIETISILRHYLQTLFNNVCIGVDMKNPVTDKQQFAFILPQSVIS